jgi:multisubunit Na+/H+ antiporter MnhE subunit
MSTLFLLLVLLWIALTQSVDIGILCIGVGLSIAITMVQRFLFPFIHVPSIGRLLVRIHLLACFIAVLMWRFAISTLYTSRLILSGKHEGRIVALPVRLEDPVGQFLLLNSITFTPSTISLLLEGDTLYVHWLRARGEQGDWQMIKESLEKRLIKIFEGRKQ